ncbi:MAG TPA: RNA polymerase sigma factor [Polyangia bacterium]|nr:RNA polymerase sigma factor [Polyangia bacterium]
MRRRETENLGGGSTEVGAFLIEVARLRGFLWNLAVRLVRDNADADDLVHDTVERALSCRHMFRAGSSLKAWMRSIMRNLFIDQWRRGGTSIELDPDRMAGPAPGTGDFGPLDVLQMEHILAAAGQLSPRDREMFASAHVHQLSYREIAAQFCLTVETVGTRLFRIRRRLRAILEQWLATRTLPPVPLPSRRARPTESTSPAPTRRARGAREASGAARSAA